MLTQNLLLFQPIRFKTKTTFSALQSFSCFYFKILLALADIFFAVTGCYDCFSFGLIEKRSIVLSCYCT